ncbi:MAG TPA: hypothetical protein VKZ84_05940 [Bacteriovoracaceae bacterium]|nr:hypothetical protein [Bacteriovoracaceae bacterium]
MHNLLIFSLLLSCSSLVKLDERNNEDTHASKKISFHQMGLEFNQQEKRLNEENQDKLNKLSQKIISTSQPIKKITIYSNPHQQTFRPKEKLTNYDRAVNTKRFLEKDLHTQSKIEIKEEEGSAYKYKKDSDILILVEYL